MEATFSIGEDEKKALRKCEKMEFLMDHLEEIEERSIVKDPFMGMVYNIIYQQVSFASGNAIWKRWLHKYKNSSIEDIAAAFEEDLRACGLSRSKAKYVKGLALECIKNKDLTDREKLLKMDNQDIHNLYIPIKGIGPWSIKMFLIFTLGRKNIRSYGDLALKKGVEWLHGEKDITEERYLELTDIYSPYNTAASFYFWEITLKKLPKKAPSFSSYKLMTEKNL